MHSAAHIYPNPHADYRTYRSSNPDTNITAARLCRSMVVMWCQLQKDLQHQYMEGR